MSSFEVPQPQPQAHPDSALQAPIAPADRDRDHDHIHGHGGDAVLLHARAQHINAAPPPPLAKAKENHQLEAANIAHFDALGHDFDKRHPDAADFADRLAGALRRVIVLDEDATAVLDYACGSGQVSRALAPHVAQLVGVDISPRMVQVYNARANAQGLEPHEMRAVGSLTELQQEHFDIVVCSMAYHHFPSVKDVTSELVKYLKPRGTLAVADIARVEADESETPIMAKYELIVAHTRGFAEGEIRALFEGAGLENVAFDRFTTAKKEGRDVVFFLATGTKPAASAL